MKKLPYSTAKNIDIWTGEREYCARTMKTQMDAIELCNQSFYVLVAMRTKFGKAPFETYVHSFLHPATRYNEIIEFLEAFEVEYQKELGRHVVPAHDTKLANTVDFSARSIVVSEGGGDDGL